MKYLKTFEMFRFLSEDFENNFPEKIKIFTSNGSYELVRADFTREINVIRCSYWHNTAADGNVSHDGEPDLLMFDIYFFNNENGMKTHVNITYGDNMVSEFSIEAPNKIIINHYNGFNSKLDRETQFGFEDSTIKDLVNLINKFDETYDVNPEHLKFIDKYPDSYKAPKSSVPDSNVSYYDDEIKYNFPTATQKWNEYPLSQGKKVLIINNSRPPENRYLNNILRYLQLRGINNIIASTPDELRKIIRNNKISAVISSGSENNVTDEHTNEMNYIALKNLKCPFLGICFGFQSLARIYGSTILSGDFNHDNIILQDVKYNSLFKNIDLEKQQFSISFHDYPENCPKGFKVVCKIDGKISGIADELNKKWGFLFHPEDLEATWKIMDNFIELSNNRNKEQKAIKKGVFK